MIKSGREMTWCSHCGKNINTSRDYTTNIISCVECGKVLFDDIYTEEATFVNDASGGAGLRSRLVRNEGACFKSQRRSLQKGKVSTNELICKNRSTTFSHSARQYKGREMIWCSYCARKSRAAHNSTSGSICCVDCGKILSEDVYTKKATFFNGEAGKSIPRNRSYAIAIENTKEDDEMEELIAEDTKGDCYSKTKSHECSYDNKQESYNYNNDFDYDYDGGDEDDDS